MKAVFFLLSSLLGFVFLYSGYTKLYPIELFEYTFVDLGIGGWHLAPFIARFMIGLEFFIGILLVFSLYIKRFTIKLTIGSLFFFSAYLISIMLREGNNSNCGCFGTALVMTPLQALIKNGIMLVVSCIIFKYYEGFNFNKAGKWLFLSLGITSFGMPHVLNYVDFNYSEAYLTKKENTFKLELDSVYKDAKIRTPPKTLSTGKHVIAFMSMTCPHCRIAAKKLRIFKQKNPTLPIYFILNGDYQKIHAFFDDTKARNIDYCILNGKNFVYLAGLNMPAIYLVNNSVVDTEVNYMELDQAEIEKWVDKNE